MILSIDIGFKKPGIILFSVKDSRAVIKVYNGISFDTRIDSIKIWKYFLSQKLEKVIIEQQHINSPKNFAFMGFIEGFFAAHGIEVSIVRPFAANTKHKGVVTRTVKKNYSVEYLNRMLEKDNIEARLSKGDSDVCDAINIGLKHLGITSIKAISFHLLHEVN